MVFFNVMFVLVVSNAHLGLCFVGVFEDVIVIGSSLLRYCESFGQYRMGCCLTRGCRFALFFGFLSAFGICGIFVVMKDHEAFELFSCFKG